MPVFPSGCPTRGRPGLRPPPAPGRPRSRPRHWRCPRRRNGVAAAHSEQLRPRRSRLTACVTRVRASLAFLSVQTGCGCRGCSDGSVLSPRRCWVGFLTGFRRAPVSVSPQAEQSVGPWVDRVFIAATQWPRGVLRSRPFRYAVCPSVGSLQGQRWDAGVDVACGLGFCLFLFLFLFRFGSLSAFITRSPTPPSLASVTHEHLRAVCTPSAAAP